MKTTLYFSVCCGILLAFLSVSCESPFEATTDIGGQVADEVDSSIADYSTNYAIAADVVTVDSAFSRRDSSSRKGETVTVGTHGSETAYGYFEFDTTVLLGEQVDDESRVKLRLFMVPAEEESLTNASEVSLQAYRCSTRDSTELVDPDELSGQTLLHTFALTEDPDKGTLRPDSQPLPPELFTIKDTATLEDNIRIDTDATGDTLQIDTTGEQARIRIDSLALCVVQPDSSMGLLRLKRPYIQIEYYSVEDTGKKKTRVLRPNHAEYSVRESGAARRDSLAVSSWAPRRHAVVHLDLARYWARVDSTIAKGVTTHVISSILRIPLSAASDYTFETDSSLVLGYALTQEDTLPANEQLHFGGLNRIGSADNTILINVTDDMRGLYRQDNRPAQVNLFLRVENLRVLPSGWQIDNEWRTVTWDIGEDKDLEIETAFALTD